MNPDDTVRRTFLCGMAAVYLVAFASVYVQYPGLFGCDGLEPAYALVTNPRVSSTEPSLALIRFLTSTLPEFVAARVPDLPASAFARLTIDAWYDVVMLAGMGVAACVLVFPRWCMCSVAFAALWGLYYSVFGIGQTFLSFQWDILLLEMGFLTIWMAPLFPMATHGTTGLTAVTTTTTVAATNPKKPHQTKKHKKDAAAELTTDAAADPSLNTDAPAQPQPQPQPAAGPVQTVTRTVLVPTIAERASRFFDGTLLVWAIRWCVFRLMFESGVVKLQSMCHTWLGLTALHYHYATQCLPNPISWYAHQLPGAVQELSVAATLFIEIPAAVLIIAPTRRLRIAGAYVQLLLQALILLTGNYTYFNYLTITGLIVCFDAEHLNWLWRSALPAFARIACCCLCGGGRRRAAQSSDSPYPPPTVKPCTRFGAVIEACVDVAGIWLVAHMSGEVFSLDLKSDLNWTHAPIRVKGADYAGSFYNLMQAVVPASGLYISAVFVWVSLRTLWSCVTRIGSCVRQFARLIHSVYWIAISGALIAASFPTLDSLLQNDLSQIKYPPLVRQLNKAARPFHIVNSYGLFRRMTGVGPDRQPGSIPTVERPEVVIEYSYRPSGDSDWAEFEFAHKPGARERAPTIVAPHQPRLDWQMWFAALGTYQHNPWVVHLMDKLLRGSPAVLALLDPSAARVIAEKGRPPVRVRARLFHYDFTRWTARFPSDDRALSDKNAKNWWVRTQTPVEYFPEMGKDGGLRKYLDDMGLYEDGCARMAAAAGKVAKRVSTARKQPANSAVGDLKGVSVWIVWFVDRLLAAVAWCRANAFGVVTAFVAVSLSAIPLSRSSALPLLAASAAVYYYAFHRV